MLGWDKVFFKQGASSIFGGRMKKKDTAPALSNTRRHSLKQIEQTVWTYISIRSVRPLSTNDLSAKHLTVVLCSCALIPESEMWMINRSRPSTEPCRTPLITWNSCDLQPSMFTNCFQTNRKDLIKLYTLPLIPLLNNLRNKFYDFFSFLS